MIALKFVKMPEHPLKSSEHYEDFSPQNSNKQNCRLAKRQETRNLDPKICVNHDGTEKSCIANHERGELKGIWRIVKEYNRSRM
jgi:hypothetical protein